LFAQLQETGIDVRKTEDITTLTPIFFSTPFSIYDYIGIERECQKESSGISVIFGLMARKTPKQAIQSLSFLAILSGRIGGRS
jgi:hypothetical protein